MSAPRARGVRLAVLAALALAGGTAATLLSSKAIQLRGAPPASDPSLAPRGAPVPGPAPPSEARQFPRDSAAAPRDARVDESPIPPPRPGASTLVLTARNGDTGKPAAGALVRISQPGPDREARTDGEGFARVERLLPGHSVVRLSSPGRRSAARPLRLVDDEEVRVELVLHPEVTIAGRVVSADGGAPIAGASVRVTIDPLVDEGPWRGLAPDTVAVTTGADGRFTAVAGLPSGQARVAVFAAGFREETLWVRLPADAAAPADVEVRLLRSGLVRGFVRSPEGEPVAGAEVLGWAGAPGSPRAKRTAEGWTIRAFDRVEFQAVTAADGSYALEGLARGVVYGVSAKRNNRIFLGGPRAVVVPDTGDATLDLVLGEPGSIRFDWGSRGPPSQGLHFRIMPTPDTDSPSMTTYIVDPRAEGGLRASIAAPPGTWRISLTSYFGDELVPQETVTVVSGRETVVPVLGAGDRVAGGPMAVSGVVVDGRGAGIAGADVHLRLAEDEPSWKRAHFLGHWLGKTDAHGAFQGVVRDTVTGPGTRVKLIAQAPGFEAGETATLELPSEGLRIALDAHGGVRGRVSVPPGPVAPVNLALFFRGEGAPVPYGARPTEQQFLRLGPLADGSFVHEGLSPGPGVLEIRTEAGSSGPIPVVVPAGAVLDLGTIDLPASRTVRCRVVDPDGVPLAQAAVRVVGDGPLLPEGRTGADGTCILAGVAPEGALLRATAVGWHPTTLPAPESGAAEFVLRRGGRIVGAALDSRGRPAGAWWVVARSRETQELVQTRSDLRGRFEMHVAPGAHDLELRTPEPPGWTVPDPRSTAGRAEVVVEDGRAVTVEIRASR